MVKPATIRDVAGMAGVSVASVSRVLTGAGQVTEPTRKRVLEAVEALNYVPHSGARSLSTSRTSSVGVILPDLFGEFFSELIRGLDLAARQAGYHLIVSSSHDDAEEAAAAIRSMRGRVDGLIVLSPHLDGEKLAGGLAGGMPVSVPIVLLGRLAVDREYAGRGLGFSLLQHATMRALEAADAIGVRAILVHAINDEIVPFYERFGFTAFPEARRTLFFLVQDARATLAR